MFSLTLLGCFWFFFLIIVYSEWSIWCFPVFLRRGMATVADGELLWWKCHRSRQRSCYSIFLCQCSCFFLCWCLSWVMTRPRMIFKCQNSLGSLQLILLAFPKEPSLALAPITHVCRPCGRFPIILGIFRVQFASLGQIGPMAFPQPGLLSSTKPVVGKTPLSSHCSAAMDEFTFYLLDL